MVGQVILVGCGNMGYAMLEKWLASGRLTPGDVVVVEPDEGLRRRAGRLGLSACADAADLPESSPRLVILAIKPQAVADVAPGYARFRASATFLSIAAGISIAALEKIFGADAAIIRCMPNTPAAIGKGMMVTVDNGRINKEMQAFVRNLLSTNGEVAEIYAEHLMDAVTAISGSGPAYVFHFIECLTAAAEAVSLPSDVARRLAAQTVYGAAALAADSGKDPDTLRRQVTSPNGTTAAALSVLMDDDRLKTLVIEAVEAARRRSVELGEP